MKKIEETKFSCEFCARAFVKEKTLLSHICERKHRWLERDKKSSKIGFSAWLQFYAKTSMGTKVKTYEDFIKSAYYSAFVKFGTYCVEVNVLNVPRYVDWLLKEQIKIDVWNKDSTYNRFLLEYLKSEDPFDAIYRSIEYSMDLAEQENISPCDCLRYCSANKICYAITMGRISPWLLYQSDSGIQFLSSLNGDHVKIINDYINPEQWAIKFNRDPGMAKQINGLLSQAGY